MALPLGLSAVEGGTVLVLITVVAAPIAAVAFARSGPAWKSLGKGRLSIEPAPATQRTGGHPPAGEDEEVREEVHQMIVAANERRRRRGQAPLDVEAETERRLANRLDG